MKNIIFSTIFLSFILAEINFSGDARIRPRLDIKDYGADNGKSLDFYYLYRARLNIDANIGEGWFFKSKLGTNDVSGMVKMGEVSTYNHGPGYAISSRPELSFLNLYYGFKKENFGFWGGAMPLKYNSSLDIHFYPDKMVDIPWILWNNGSMTGFSGYIYNFNWFLSINENRKEINTINNADEKNIDPISFGFDFSMNWSDMIKTINPRAIMTIANSHEPWPMTFGLDIDFGTIFKINSMLSYYFTSQSFNENYKYKGSHLRIKLDREIGPGILNFWTDIASHQDEMHESGNYQTDYFYLWLDYSYKLFKSDFGAVTIKPTIRMLNEKTSDTQFTRVKLEITTEIKFK